MTKLNLKHIFNLVLISMVFSSCYKSDDVAGEIIVTPSEFTQKLLIEDYTGTWCVYCTGAGDAIHNAVHGSSGNNRFVPVGIHYRSLTNVEEMQNSYGETLVANFNPDESFPKVTLNRTEAVWSDDYLIANLESKLNKYAPVGLAINSTLVGNTIDITVKVGFVGELTTVDNYKLAIYLLEDGLVFPQANASLPNFPAIIDNYVHDDVLRFSFTDVLGDALPNQIAINHRFEKSFTSISLPSSIQNNSNIRIVAFVLDANNNCLNVQMAPVGEDKDFD